MYWYIHFLPGWCGVEIAALPKRPVNYFKLDQQIRQNELRTYCPKMYTVTDLLAALRN